MHLVVSAPITSGSGRVVGADSQRTRLLLTDLVDNGRRGASGEEALYLHGAGTAVGQNGLRILGQSTLYMPAHVKVYANIGGQVTDLHTLFTGAQVTIPFDEGFISRTLLGDFNLDSILNATDLDLMAAAILRRGRGSVI